jgi:hypothetical protein
MLTPLTNHEKIGRALDHLRRGLLPLIDARLRPEDKASWQIRSRRGAMWKSTDLDVKDCLEILDKFWDGRFRVRSWAVASGPGSMNSSTRFGTSMPIEDLQKTFQTTMPGERSILPNACSPLSDLTRLKTCEFFA